MGSQVLVLNETCADWPSVAAKGKSAKPLSDDGLSKPARKSSSKQEVLISLGQNTDKIMDLFQIPDAVLPGLHQLTTTI